jgi:hypothetical protein
LAVRRRDAGSGVMDEGGEWVEHRDVRLGMEAYRERLSRAK